MLDSYDWFKGLVKDRRKLDDAQLAKRRRRPRLHRPAGARAEAGRRASATRRPAIAWLEKEKKVPADTPVRDCTLEPRFSELSFLHVAAWRLRCRPA